jgi:hypothetical protein
VTARFEQLSELRRQQNNPHVMLQRAFDFEPVIAPHMFRPMAPPPTKLKAVFVFDGTDSMEDVIEAANEKCIEIAGKLRASFTKIELAAVVYRDLHDTR